MTMKQVQDEQLKASDNMIKDLVGQIQTQKKEGGDLMAQNLSLSDKVLKLEQEIAQLKIEIQTGFINEPITPMKNEDGE